MTRSTRKPIIGLTGRRIEARVVGVPVGFHDAPLDAYMAEYATSVIGAGGIPLHLPLDVDPESLVDLLDGIILVGGADIDPRRYGGVPDAQTGVLEPIRDQFEFDLFAAAMQADIPVLGICRGAQLINAALGGTLEPDLPLGVGESHASYAYPRAHRSHRVTFASGSVAHRLYGDSARVNSFHHQAVRHPGADVVVTGRADDGVVEAFEVAGRSVLGIQWHPECFHADPTFTWLVDTSIDHQHQESAA